MALKTHSLLLLLMLASCKHDRAPSGSKQSTTASAHRAIASPSASASTSASSAASGQTAPPGTALSSPRFIVFGVFFADPVTTSLAKRAKDLIVKAMPEVKIVEGPAMDAPAPTISVTLPDLTVSPPPSERSLSFTGHGMTPPQIKSAAHSQGFLMVEWHLDADPDFATLRQAEQVIVDIAKLQDGFVWDDSSRDLFTVDEWKTRRLDSWDGNLPWIEKQIVIHYYEDEGRHRAVSLGLSKLGLPDVAIQDVTPDLAARAPRIVDMALQELAEGANLNVAGKLAMSFDATKHKGVRADLQEMKLGPDAKGAGTLSFYVAKPEEGDAANRLYELRFDDFKGATESERLAAAVESIWGSSQEKVLNEKENDEELEALAARVQAKLPEIHARFAKRKLGDRLQVKTMFETDDGGGEWMWSEVATWDGESLRGTLTNTPDHVKKLALGAKVTLQQAGIADYLYISDGKMEGAESTEIIRRHHGM